MNPRDALARALIEQKSGQSMRPNTAPASMGFSRPVTYKSYDSADAAAVGNGTPFLQIGSQVQPPQMPGGAAQPDPSLMAHYIPTPDERMNANMREWRANPDRRGFGGMRSEMSQIEKDRYNDALGKGNWDAGTWVNMPREKPAKYR